LSSSIVLDPTQPAPAVPDDVIVHVLDNNELVTWPRIPELDTLLVDVATNPEFHEMGMTPPGARSWILDWPHQTWVLLERDGRLVATASADAQDGSGTWMLIYAGVHPDVREQGLGRVMKQQLHAAVAARGATRLQTQNDERNVEILALNRSLGYQPQGVRVGLARPGV
jgi:GNAT superfamily N-acetyltransferase